MCPSQQYDKYPVPSSIIVTESPSWCLLLEKDIHSHHPGNLLGLFSGTRVLLLSFLPEKINIHKSEAASATDPVSLWNDGFDIWSSSTSEGSRFSIFQPLKGSKISLRPWATVYLAAIGLLCII